MLHEDACHGLRKSRPMDARSEINILRKYRADGCGVLFHPAPAPLHLLLGAEASLLRQNGLLLLPQLLVDLSTLRRLIAVRSGL